MQMKQFQCKIASVIWFWNKIEVSDRIFEFKHYKNANIVNFVYNGKTLMDFH